jgi:PAS domain S-box-containing protein
VCNGTQTEQALRDSELSYRRLFEAAQDGILILDVDLGRITDANPFVCKLLGFSHREMIGNTVGELSPFKDMVSNQAMLELLLKHGYVRYHDLPLETRDGRKIAVEFVSNVYQAGDKKVIQCNIRDITDRKKSEQRMALLNTCVSHLNDIVMVTEADPIDEPGPRIVFVNEAFERLTGYTPAETLGRSPRFLQGEKTDRRILAEIRQALAQRQPIRRQIINYGKDGTEYWLDMDIVPIFDSEGKCTHFAAIERDITEAKRNEEARGRLAAIVECSDDAIISKTLDGIIISWNQGAERLYGYAAEEIIGQPIFVLFTPDHYQEYLQIMEKVRKGERIAAFETVRRKKDGTTINVSVAIAPIEIKNGELVGSSNCSHDITRVKQLEEQFRQSQKLEAIGRLAGGVAHDFNNLLTVMYGYTQLLLDRLPPGDSQEDMLQEIKKAGERAASLTRQLLAFSRNQVLELKVLDLNAVVTESEKMLKRLVGEDIDLATVLNPNLGRVETDPGQLEQVLMNLVINARDAMPQGGKITIETANTVLDQTYCQLHRDVEPGNYVMLAMRDTGCGMNEHTKAHLFEPFFTTKDLGKGTGLGLAMIHGFVEQSGGHILVESEVGLGSTFKVYLPEVQKALRSSGKLPQTIEKMPRGNETILLVEDDDAVRAFARQVLQDCGYIILEAASGQKAIQLIKQHPHQVHILVSDVVMPGISGREVAEQVKALEPAIKVLFLSGYTDDAVIRCGILPSEVAFLQKPFTPSALGLKVRKVLDRQDTPSS